MKIITSTVLLSTDLSCFVFVCCFCQTMPSLFEWLTFFCSHGSDCKAVGKAVSCFELKQTEFLPTSLQRTVTFIFESFGCPKHWLWWLLYLPGGRYSPKVPFRVCAAQRARDFGSPDPDLIPESWSRMEYPYSRLFKIYKIFRTEY